VLNESHAEIAWIILDNRLKSFFLKIPQLIIIFLSVALFILPLKAEEKSGEKENQKKYYSSTSFSLVLTRGNNRALSLSFDTEQNLRLAKNVLSFKGSIIHSSSDNQKKSEIYYSHFKYDRKISSRAYLLGLVRVERNKLAGYNFRLALSVGAGYVWIQGKKIEIFSEGSFGWSNENISEKIIPPGTNDVPITERTFSTSFFSSIFTGKLVYTISSAAQFAHQETLFLNWKDMSDYRLNSYSSISASVSRNFALKTSLQIIYEHKPVLGHKNTDFFLLSSIVIKF